MKRLLRSTSVPIAVLLRPDDQIALPVPGHGTVIDLGGPSALSADEAIAKAESVLAG